MMQIFQYFIALRAEEFTLSASWYLVLQRLCHHLKILIASVVRRQLVIKKHTVVQQLEELPCKKALVLETRQRINEISSPSIYTANQWVKYPSLIGKVPDVEIYLLSEVSCIGKSSAVMSECAIYHHYLNNITPRNASKSGYWQGVKDTKHKKIWHRIKKVRDINNSAIHIHLMNEHACNYYHWMFEVLPKLVKINQIILDDNELFTKQYILLVDSSISVQCIESISMIANFNYEIEFIQPGELVQSAQLLFCTDLWLSLDTPTFKPVIQNEFFVDCSAVSLVRDALRKTSEMSKPTRKIYFERAPYQSRNLSNAREIRDLLQSNGFEIIKPEILTLEEQINLMMQTKILIGSSGAGFSNIIFMQEGSEVVIFSPEPPSANLYIFQPMADVAKIKLTYLFTQNKSKSKVNINNIHQSNVFINPDELREVISGLGAPRKCTSASS